MMGTIAIAFRIARCLAAVFALTLAPQIARADVLEIGDDGSVIVHAGPGVTAANDRTTLIGDALPVAASARRSSGHAVPSPAMRDAIQSASSSYEISPSLVAAVARQESAFNPSAVSPKGARGVMQLMPETQGKWCRGACTPGQNVAAGTAYLKSLLTRYHGDIALALAAYNAGPAAVDRFGGIPPYRETTAYLDDIFANLSTSALAGAQ
jgi:soluble lytic murein transglycosylase-like protein